MDLYWLNTSGDGTWETLDNWNTASDGSGDAPTAVPWVDGAYVDTNLHYNGGLLPSLYSTIDGTGSGICSIDLQNFGTINGGSFTGGTGEVDNYSVINGGTFNIIVNEPSANAVINYAVVTGDMENYVSCTIYDGIYSGTIYNGYSGGNADGGYIAGGTYSIDDFNNYNGTINLPNIQTTSGGDPYTGNWLGQAWVNGAWNGIAPIGDLYYTNASSDGNWETLTNWNTASDGRGDLPTEIPWTNVDGSTNASNLYDATGGAGITINYPFTSLYGSDNSTCYIDYVSNFGQIYTGTFSGSDFYNYSTINGGTFSGDNFGNYSGTINNGTFSGNYFYSDSTINEGTFSGSGFDNNGTIYGGTFSGDGFGNRSQIYGGTFSNNGFTNQYGFLLNATFTGTNFDNSYGIVANCDIQGGFNNVPNGFDPYVYIVSELAFAQIGQVFDTYFSGPSTGTTSGPLGPYYVYADSIGAIKYPTPTGGGGGGIDISRLLGLPFFIKI
jgi:hypothetical protein